MNYEFGILYLPNILGMEQHRPEGFLEKLVEPLKPSGRFPSFLRRYVDSMKWLALALVVFIMAAIVGADMGTLPRALRNLYDFPNGDKAGHFILFGLLSLILNLMFLSRPHADSRRLILTVSLVLFLLVGLEEWSQSLFAVRTMDFFDLLAGYAGIATFAWLAWRLRKRM